jgi:hypothetical protein
MIKNTAPIRPNITPKALSLLNFTPRKITPTIRANSGVKPLMAPANELDIRVCARGNKNAGMALPKKPLMMKYL